MPGRSLEHFALPLDGAHGIWHQSGEGHDDPGRGCNSCVDTGYYLFWLLLFLPENKRRKKTIIEMRTCLTKFSRIFECGAVSLLPLVEQRARVHPLRDSPRHSCRGLIASFPGPCASSGGRLPAALFMVFQLDSKGAKVYKHCRSRQELSNKILVQTSIHLQNLASIQPRTGLSKFAKN